jgi:hypothetical protein
MCIRYQVIDERNTRPSGLDRKQFAHLGRTAARHSRPAVLVAEDLAHGITNYIVSPLRSFFENGRTRASEAVIQSHQEGTKQ